MKIALIDADVLAYSIAFACQQIYYKWEGKEYKGIILLRDRLSSLGINYKKIEDLNIEKIVKTENPIKAFSILKRKVNNICKTTQSDGYKLFLTASGNDNFRKGISITNVYKGNRTQEKPVLHEQIREYMIKHHDALLANKCEADDVMGIWQCEKRYPKRYKSSVICSIDKDMRQVPGEFYNWDSGIREHIPERGYIRMDNIRNKDILIGGGKIWFLAQMLMGDKADNISGVCGFGPKNVYKFLTNHLEDGFTVNELMEEVYNMYCESLSRDRFIENARLLWICQKKDEISKDFDWMGRYCKWLK